MLGKRYDWHPSALKNAHAPVDTDCKFGDRSQQVDGKWLPLCFNGADRPAITLSFHRWYLLPGNVHR